ncbi:hypothetical protein [Dubosiella newyorkensis]|nr:hypothetical protein [Dubosiella newyorkensis]
MGIDIQGGRGSNYGDVQDECCTGPPIVQFDPFHKRLRGIR